MSTSTAIGMVSESLTNLLTGEWKLSLSPESDPSTTMNVTILAPDETGMASDPRINLFLYKVQENPALKNLDWEVKRGEPNRLVPPPLSLNLFYLMTPYAQSDEATGNITAHELLGDAMRIFYENPIVPQVYLVDGLKDSREQIRIMLNTLDLEELSRVWSTFIQPFRLSVLYEVSVVQLDMLSESERIMARRVQHIGVPDVRAPFSPPVVEKIEPQSGPAGTLITCYGKNLSGWKAYVSMMGRQIVKEQELTDDIFSFSIPVELSPGQAIAPGFHEIRLDISHLYRRTFFFEVTE